MISPAPAARPLRAGVTCLLGSLTDLLLPPTCLLCDELLEQSAPPLCAECLAGFEELRPPLCARCGQPLPAGPTPGAAEAICPECQVSPPACACIRSLFGFEGAAWEAIRKLKFQRQLGLAPFFARLLAAADWPEIGLPAQQLLVPVPLHRRKLAQRGYNQSAVLARALARITRVPVSLGQLQRALPTPSQSEMASRAERARNVERAFRVRSPAPIKGKRICLIDDVVTTGATLSACARVLQDAGARTVVAVTLARTIRT